MYIKVTGSKIIGFGKVGVLPNEIAKIPAEYENHPMIDFYIQQGFIEKVDKPADLVVAPSDTADVDASDELTVYRDSTKKYSASALKAMKLDELKLLATSMGIELDTNESKATLQQKITKAYEG